MFGFHCNVSRFLAWLAFNARRVVRVGRVISRPEPGCCYLGNSRLQPVSFAINGYGSAAIFAGADKMPAAQQRLFACPQIDQLFEGSPGERLATRPGCGATVP